MAYKLSLDYVLAKALLKSMDHLIVASGDSIKQQIIRLQQIDVPTHCQGDYANATVEKLTQLNKEWQILMLQLKDCKSCILNRVERLHAYDLEQRAKEETNQYQPISSFESDKFFKE